MLADVNFLQGAYQKIKSNQGIITKDSGQETLDKLDNKWFNKTSKRLLDGSFQFRSARRAMILKPNKQGEKVLGIDNPRDKIVQQAMKMVLELIYEEKFLDTSHGFRLSRGCHSALEMIRLKWMGISWFLKFDVEKCYDDIDRHRLVNILKENIEDPKFLDLIHKFFNSRVVVWDEHTVPEVSMIITQGSILLPTLSNIYLHKLDEEIARIAEDSREGKNRRILKNGFNAGRQMSQKKNFKILSVEKRAEIISKHRAACRKV